MTELFHLPLTNCRGIPKQAPAFQAFQYNSKTQLFATEIDSLAFYPDNYDISALLDSYGVGLLQ